MKKIIAIITAFAFLFLVGCENVSYEQNNSSSSPSFAESSANIYDTIASNLPVLSFETPSEPENSEEISSESSELSAETSVESENQEPKEIPFTIITDEVSTFSYDEESVSMIGNAVKERNEFLKSQYGAVIEVKEMSGDALTKELRAAIESGTEFCDMLAISAVESANLYKNGLLEDLNSLPGFDAQSEFFNQQYSTKLATNSTLYLLPDPTTMVYEDVYVMFYNRDLLKLPEGMTDLESLTLQGKWTWDKFNEVIRLSASEVYDKSIADLENDTFGFTAYADDNTFPLAMFAASGESIVGNTYKKAVEITIDYDTAQNICDQLLGIYDTNGRYPFDGAKAMEAFENNRAVFFCNTFDYFYALRDGSGTESKYGFLPMPKSSEEQEGYHSMADNRARVISVPKTIQTASESKRQFVSIMITATCALGNATVKDEFINSFIMMYLYDNTETMILDTICESVYFDFSYIIGNLYFDIADCTTNAINEHLTVGNSIKESFRRRKYYFDEDSAVFFQ